MKINKVCRLYLSSLWGLIKWAWKRKKKGKWKSIKSATTISVLVTVAGAYKVRMKKKEKVKVKITCILAAWWLCCRRGACSTSAESSPPNEWKPGRPISADSEVFLSLWFVIAIRVELYLSLLDEDEDEDDEKNKTEYCEQEQESTLGGESTKIAKLFFVDFKLKKHLKIKIIWRPISPSVIVIVVVACKIDKIPGYKNHNFPNSDF